MLKIFSIRDRMLDYFQVPVVVNREQDLAAAIARGVNSEGEDRNEIALAPDHYELWQIGEVDDQGNLTSKREFRFNCASLVRRGVWKRGPAGGGGAEGDEGATPGRPGRPGGPTGAGPGAPAGAQGATAVEAQKPHPAIGGGNPSSDR